MNSDKLKELLEKNSNYWQSRALDSEIRAVENEEDYLKRIKGIYDAAQRDIEKKMANVYARYASNNKITLKEAYKQLPKKMETEYKADVNEYIRLAQEHQGDPKWKQYLLNQSLMHKHSVLNQLQTEYRKVIYDIDMEETAGKFLEKIYTNTSYYNQYLNNDEVFAKVDKDRIQSLINENWSGGGSFSENIWGNKEKLIKALDETVIRGMAIGRSFDDMAKELAKKMDTGYNNAARLIMTESARMDNMSLLDTYKRMGVQKLEFVATLDMKTSEICRAMDGTIIDIENAKIGLNVPPLHPYCRSVIAPVMDEEIDKGGDKRIYRDVKTGKSVMGKNRNYIDYLKEELGDEKQAQAIASTRNDLASLVAAISYVDITPTGETSITYTNPDAVKTLSSEYKETLLTMKGPTINNLNNKLSNQIELNDADKELIEKIDEALDKIEYFNGEVTTDIRPGNNNPLDGLSIGDEWVPRKYLFSTKKNKYYDNAEYRFVIISKTGRDVGKKVLNYKVNKEVIFKRNTTFRITDIKVKNKIVYYYMEEIIKNKNI